MSDVQLDLFGRSAPLPEGFIYQPDLISEDEENECAEQIRQLAFERFEFRGYHGKRRTISFGFFYDFSAGRCASRIQCLHSCSTCGTERHGLADWQLRP